MKIACVILTVIIFLACMAVCIMVKFATEITVEDKKRDRLNSDIYKYPKSMGVIALRDNSSLVTSERFPYVAAVTRNSSPTWSFVCFASIVLVKWIVTSAHCRKPGTTHRVLLYHDFAKDYSHTYPILFWRVHEHFNLSNPTPKYDIAVAKLNLEANPYTFKLSVFDEKIAPTPNLEASVWKTVSTMDKKMFLTNDFEMFRAKVVSSDKCFESYGVQLDDGLICTDMSAYDDCFVHEFGPIYHGDKIIGVLAVKPRECDIKVVMFTNVSYYTNWILRSTHTTYYG